MPLASDQQTHIPGTADLDNPLYYLENFDYGVVSGFSNCLSFSISSL